MKKVKVFDINAALIDWFETTDAVCEAMARRGYIEPRIQVKGRGYAQGGITFLYA